jgi:hypothetical protein
MPLFSPKYFVFPSHNKKAKDENIYKTVILSAVLHGCKTWFITLREEHKLRVFENRVHNDKLHSQYSSPNIVRVIKSKRMRWEGHVTCMGVGRGVYRVLVRRSEGNRPL